MWAIAWVSLAALVILCAVPMTADALSRTNRGSFTSSANHGTGSFVTTAFTPSNNSLLVVVVAAELNGFDTAFGDAVTISGGGLSWTQRLLVEDPTLDIDEFSDAIIVFTAPVTTGASMQLTIDAGAFNAYHYIVDAFDYTGYNTSSPIGATASGYAHNPSSGVTTITLSASPNTSSEVLASLAMGWDTTDLTAGTGWTQHYNDYVDFGRLQSQTRNNSSSATVQWDDADAVYTRLQSAIEIKDVSTMSTRSVLVKPPNNLGLVGYWSFNEGTGTVATDFSGNGNHGTFSGISDPPSATSGWTNGKRSRAIQFDNSDDTVEAVHSTSLNVSSTMTVAFWIKRNTTAETNAWFSKSSTAADSGWFLEGNADGGFFFSDSAGGTEATAVQQHLRANEWAHVAITYNSGASQANRFIFYVNGAAIADTDGNVVAAGLTTTSESVRIGKFWSGGEPCNCTMDEVRMYNRALTATEIASLARAGAVRFTSSSVDLQRGSSLQTGLVGHWTFDGPDITTTVTDRSGSANHGYYINGATSSAKTIGKLGQAFDFGTAANVIDAGSGTSLNITGELSIALWMKKSTLSGFDSLVGKCTVACGGSDGWWLDTSGDEITFFILSNSTITSSVNLETNRWYHVVMTYNDAANSVVFYVDGAAVADNGGAAESSSIASTAGISLKLGGEFFSGEICSCVMDDTRIYNRTLTATEVTQLYNLGKAKIKP